MTDHTLRGLSAAEVLQRYLDAYPAFRIKPKGEPGSPARIEQENLMALEDAARAALDAERWDDALTPPPSYLGMSLRDWFAGQALMGFAAVFEGKDAAHSAMSAYRMADAMLAEREKTS